MSVFCFFHTYAGSLKHMNLIFWFFRKRELTTSSSHIELKTIFEINSLWAITNNVCFFIFSIPMPDRSNTQIKFFLILWLTTSRTHTQLKQYYGLNRPWSMPHNVCFFAFSVSMPDCSNTQTDFLPFFRQFSEILFSKIAEKVALKDTAMMNNVCFFSFSLPLPDHSNMRAEAFFIFHTMAQSSSNIKLKQNYVVSPPWAMPSNVGIA